jgi:preprotein translocase SecE subunit
MIIQFIKDAITELEHIVWPTPTESKNYMMYTVGTIVVIWIFLAVMASILRSGLQTARAQFPHTPLSSQTVSWEVDVDSIIDKVIPTNQSQALELSTGSVTPVIVSAEATN